MSSSVSYPPWVKIVQDLVKEYPKETTQSLSTLTSRGTPTTRSIVHRQLHLPTSSSPSPTPLFISTTDVRSTKTTQITPSSPHVSINWWFPTPNSQIRIEGTAVVVPLGEETKSPGMSEVRKELWEGMSGHLRASFARTRAPGTKMESYDEGKDWPETLPTLENAKDEVQREQIKFAYKNFALVLVTPSHVDYVELKPIPNRRTEWTLEEGKTEWDEQILVP